MAKIDKSLIMNVLNENYNTSLFSAQGREMIADKIANALDAGGKSVNGSGDENIAWKHPIQKAVKPEGEKPKKSDEKVVKEKKVEKKVIEKNNKPGSKEIRDVKRKINIPSNKKSTKDRGFKSLKSKQ